MVLFQTAPQRSSMLCRCRRLPIMIPCRRTQSSCALQAAKSLKQTFFRAFLSATERYSMAYCYEFLLRPA